LNHDYQYDFYRFENDADPDNMGYYQTSAYFGENTIFDLFTCVLIPINVSDNHWVLGEI
jgi:hypothetical protein